MEACPKQLGMEEVLSALRAQRSAKNRQSGGMNGKQLRALSREYLFILVRDLESELQAEKEEGERLRAACAAEQRVG
ncbi:MAG: hypothetical protein FWF10_01690 [Clostridiales bacterium]|nr:hypothetical protein [Clostridiales bacterium]